MASEDVSPDRAPAEVRQYMAAIQELGEHPFVRQHFYQVAQLSIIVPQQQRTDLVALEFRDGAHAALIWKDDKGNWVAGAWLKLSRPDTDITSAPLSPEYFQGARAQPSLLGALELLAESIPGAHADAATAERLTASPPLPAVTSNMATVDVRRSEATIERLSIEADHRAYMTRLVCSLVTSIIIAATAYICAWYEYRGMFAHRRGDPRLTLWQFANAGTGGIAAACFLAGAFAFPLCFLGTPGKPGARALWLKILIVHGVTAVFAILIAVVISAIHIPSGH